MPLGLVLVRYWLQHASKLPSRDQARAGAALWTEFFGAVTIADLTIERQEEFIKWLKDKSYKNSYVSRTLSVGRAAIYRAWKRGEITAKPFIMDVPDRCDAREPYRLNMKEMSAFLTLAQERPHIFIFSMIMLNTLARPVAVLDLKRAQVDPEDGIIDLNPKGRKQTKKYRPIVPITDTLLPFLACEDSQRHFVLWQGKPVKSVKKGFAETVQDAKLSPEITPYSLRHTMATELRRQGVPPWEVEGMLGHRRPGVTEKYAHFEPGYLSASRKAIDSYFAALKLTFTVPAASCVSVACYLVEEMMTNPLISMVDTTGIEPVTPTMST